MVNEGRVVVTDEAWMAGGQLLATDIGSETEVELTVQDEPRLLSCPVALSIVRACGGRLRIPFDLLRRRSDRNLVISAYRRFAQADTVITLRRRRPRQVATP
jgi:hypothetical protein